MFNIMGGKLIGLVLDTQHYERSGFHPFRLVLEYVGLSLLDQDPIQFTLHFRNGLLHSLGTFLLYSHLQGSVPLLCILEEKGNCTFVELVDKVLLCAPKEKQKSALKALKTILLCLGARSSSVWCSQPFVCGMSLVLLSSSDQWVSLELKNIYKKRKGGCTDLVHYQRW